MPMPRDIGVIDTMIGLPVKEYTEAAYNEIAKGYVGGTAPDVSRFPAGYMFKGVPNFDDIGDPLDYLVSEMDRFGIEKGVIGWRDDEYTARARTEYADRFLFLVNLDPNEGMGAVRKLEEAVAAGAHGGYTFPCGLVPQVPINDKKMYPIYAKCVELGVPMFINSGVPGPRVPMMAQYVGHFDEVCWYFPELTLVSRHGSEPWEELMVKLMLKWPGLHYSTSAFRPKHLPRAIIDYANTRGADKVIYAGYFPAGLTLDVIFEDLAALPLRDHVWPKFLRENALRVFNLGG